jgi:hypothetical protein
MAAAINSVFFFIFGGFYIVFFKDLFVFLGRIFFLSFSIS